MHLDITFGLQVVKSSSLVSVLLEKLLAISIALVIGERAKRASTYK